jgi:hypothetical protein
MAQAAIQQSASCLIGTHVIGVKFFDLIIFLKKNLADKLAPLLWRWILPLYYHKLEAGSAAHKYDTGRRDLSLVCSLGKLIEQEVKRLLGATIC